MVTSCSTECARASRQRSLFSATTALASSASETSSTDRLTTIPREKYTESLLLKPLEDGRVSASFEFVLTSTSQSDSQFRLLPRALLQPIQRSGASSVHLSLNTGRWRYESWGSPMARVKHRDSYDDPRHLQTAQPSWLLLGEEAVASGAELWARLNDPLGNASRSDLYPNWKSLTSSLAGLFCASLDALDETTTTTPAYAYSDASSVAFKSLPSSKLLHAFLPSEGVCTENLTPLLKLLPCKGTVGLGSLLNPLTLFGANFQGLAVHVDRLENTHMQTGGGDRGWQIRFTVTSVFAPAVTRDISIRDWSLSSLFGRKLESGCPLAESSIVRVIKPRDPPGSSTYAVSPLPPLPSSFVPTASGAKSKQRARADRDHTPKLPVLTDLDEVEDELARSDLLQFETEGEKEAYRERLQARWAKYLETQDGEYLYDLASLASSTGGHGDKTLDIAMSWPHEERFQYPLLSRKEIVQDHREALGTLKAERTLVGHGQQRTTLQLVIENLDPKAATSVLWYENLGYFVKPYLHTLDHKIELLPVAGADGGEQELVRSARDLENPVEDMVYSSSDTSQSSRTEWNVRRSYVIEAVIRLPASSRITLTMELLKQSLPYAQHPPDANRGFDLNPSILFPLVPEDPRAALLRASQRSQNRAVQHRSAFDAPIHQQRIVSRSRSRIYLTPRLVELSRPDFSFVYTLIIFTSTIIALQVGSAINILLRTFKDSILS
ncbi:Gpi16 subunit, GPI transamidase component [Testicularia cyperi]|uniref:Gpi16 subunit, GPI transamidase component n=1 Tax=Testicularia cyperi TaxID=1882483 RepID=A0A317XVZ8_9BASI|nr:Gpi16 subunit, GPI transamidase component [Testicularia cyperi]